MYIVPKYTNTNCEFQTKLHNYA